MSTVRLKCLSEYRNRDEHIPAGKVIDVDEAYAAWLMRDAPGSFEFYKPADVIVSTKMVEEPPADKMVKPKQARKK